ncbi:DUF2141 domain-containing protein [Leeuwenhoekiella sp. NPDC079379]|uniref:DUF2141 domain-containing protein n=1 Tax=Leeuwenhoekiella sp. NPDC079379 TaxID=3364122 RepID=UPI0037CC9488
MKASPLFSKKSSIENGKASVIFENIKPGLYAIVCFQDINGNEQMDFFSNGMPKEPYGLSNNLMTMGPPEWDDCKFEVKTEPVNLEIRF